VVLVMRRAGFPRVAVEALCVVGRLGVNFMARSAPQFALRSLAAEALLHLQRMTREAWLSSYSVVGIDCQDRAQWLTGPVAGQRFAGLRHPRRSEQVTLLADLIAQIRREPGRIQDRPTGLRDVLFPWAVAALAADRRIAGVSESRMAEQAVRGNLP